MAFKLISLLFTLLCCVSLGTVRAQSTNNLSLCDKYTTLLTGTNNATNQLTVVTLLVNTAVIGSYSSLGNKASVPGILKAGTFGGQPVNLLPYFDGSIPTTNTGGTTGVGVNWLDGGGAAPLMQNKPGNSTSSLQYTLLTHLYQYFGKLLGCSGYGSAGFAPYGGDSSMYRVHQFMNLNYSEISYFIQQVGLSAASFGVNDTDVAAVASLLNSTFNMRCLPAAAVVTTDLQLQSMCINPTCPLAPDANCSAYTAAATTTTTSPSTAAATAAASTSAPTAAPTAAAGSTVTVTIPSGASTKGMAGFSPNPVNVKMGDTVVWMNTDSTAHTVTSNSGNELSSGNLAAGASYTHKFTASGTYTYKCNYHPGMGPGSVVVT